MFWTGTESWQGRIRQPSTRRSKLSHILFLFSISFLFTSDFIVSNSFLNVLWTYFSAYQIENCIKTVNFIYWCPNLKFVRDYCTLQMFFASILFETVICIMTYRYLKIIKYISIFQLLVIHGSLTLYTKFMLF